MARITLDKLTVRFGSFTAVDAVDLDIADGEFVVFLGPSGCGKTTTLRCIAGLEEATSGAIRFDGEEVNHLDAVHRNVAMVFQFISLYPHLNVRRNIAFPLQARGAAKAEIEEKVRWVSGIFDLGTILDKRPGQLPPGARQKAALARAVVREPNVLLLDEPLSAIDEQFREEMRWELRRLQKRLGVTAIYVTHDQREAMSLADRIVLMRDGRIVQIGTPAELYAEPIDSFSGFFIGSPPMNFIPAVREGDGVRLNGTTAFTRLPADILDRAGGRPIQLGVRPQHVSLGRDASEPGSFSTRIVDRYSVGREHWFDFAIGETIFKAASHGGPAPDSGEVVVALDLDHVHVFDLDGRRLDGARP